jgi:hypothetical protein
MAVADMGAAVAEAEDSMVDFMEVVIEVGIMVGIVEDTTAVIVDTMEGSMVEVFTPIGDYGDGDIGDGLFWDGLMLVGLTMPMEDTHI